MKNIVEICFFLTLIICFFVFEWYASFWFWFCVVTLLIIMQSEFVRHYTFQFIAVVFGAFYLPLNMLLMYLTKVIEPFKKEDKVVYGIFRVLFFPLQVIVTLFSIPYELILDNAH